MNVTVHETAYDLLNRLSTVLLPSEMHDVPLKQRLPALEEKAASCAHLFAAAAVKPDATPDSVVAEVVAELRTLEGGRPSRHGGGGGGSSGDGQEEDTNSFTPLRDDVADAALKSAAFRKMTGDIAGCDLATKQGRLDALDLGFNGDFPLTVRVLCAGERSLIRRHPTLGMLSDLRGEIAEYLSWCQTVDPATKTVPQRLERWSFTGPAADQRTQLDLLLRFSLAERDPFNAPSGVYALKALQSNNESCYRSVAAEDFYCTVQLIEDYRAFESSNLAALGVPMMLPRGATGFTLGTWCDFYVSYLRKALTLRSEQEQLEWLEFGTTNFRAFLRVASNEIRKVVFSSRVSDVTVTLGALAPGDCQPAKNLRTRMANLERNLDFRDAFGYSGQSDAGRGKGGKGGKGGPAAINPHVLPLISELKARLGHASKKRSGEADHDASKRTPGVGAPRGSWCGDWHWLKPDALLVMGRSVWDVSAICTDFKLRVGDHCWPVLLSTCSAQNLLARCNHDATDVAHKDLTSAAHKAVAGVNPNDKAFRAKYGRPATDDEAAKVSGGRGGGGRGRGGDSGGRSRGRSGGGRGRDRGRGRGPHFQQPVA